MGANREPISKVDTAWLRMEQPANLMMITGMVFFTQAVNFDDLLSVIEHRFLAFRRFRQKAVIGARGCYWEVDEDFDIRSHVRRTALPGQADINELEELVSELASTPLDHSKPLWQFHLVENYQEGPVLVTRIHHCYADGIALIQVLLSLTDTQPEGFTEIRSREHWKAKKVAESNIFRRLMEPAKEGIDAIGHWTMKLFEEGMNLVKEPRVAAEYASLAGEMADELAGAMLLSDDPDTRFKGRLGPRKRVAWAEPLDLHEVKGLSRVLGCTVNDVLIATITGALRHYLISRGDDVDGLEIRATVPVNLRPLEHAKELGNHFGLVFLPLPIGEENPLARVYRVHQFMDELKSSKQAAVAFGLLAALGMGPARFQRPMLEMMSRKASTVLTNVPGPRQPLYLAGSEVGELMFWVPQSGSIGMGISILSYNQKVYCGLMTDRRLVPNPREIIERFQVEFEKLLYLTLMLDDETISDEAAASDAVFDILGYPWNGGSAEVSEPIAQEAARDAEDLGADQVLQVLQDLHQHRVKRAAQAAAAQDRQAEADAVSAHVAPAGSADEATEAPSAQQRMAQKKAAYHRINAKKAARKTASAEPVKKVTKKSARAKTAKKKTVKSG